MGVFKDSQGNRWTKQQIDAKVKAAKKRKLEEFFDEYGFYFCEDCNRSTGVRIDCSHDISVDRCQKDGHLEDAWNVNNISLRCRECHLKHD